MMQEMRHTNRESDVHDAEPDSNNNSSIHTVSVASHAESKAPRGDDAARKSAKGRRGARGYSGISSARNKSRSAVSNREASDIDDEGDEMEMVSDAEDETDVEYEGDVETSSSIAASVAGIGRKGKSGDGAQRDFESLPLSTVPVASGDDELTIGERIRGAPRSARAFVHRHSMAFTILALVVLAAITLIGVSHELGQSRLPLTRSDARDGDDGGGHDDPQTAAPPQPTPKSLGEQDYNPAYEPADARVLPVFRLLQRIIPRHAHHFRLHLFATVAEAATATAASPSSLAQRVFAHDAFDDEEIRAANHPRYAALTDTFSVQTIAARDRSDSGWSSIKTIVIVNGTSNVAISSGVYWYLKYVAGCQVTWGEGHSGRQFSSLPPPSHPMPKITRDHVSLGIPRVPDDPAEVSRDEAALKTAQCVLEDDAADVAIFRASAPIRYAWNMCTFSYSAVWWDKARWRQEIDWMALHGVNMPLALSAQEFVWVRVFAEYNITLDELQEWFTGPAFLAWQRAGNIRGFAGPLSMAFMSAQADLQAYILREMRKLHMRPILPCFGGHIPKAFADHFPNASITQSQPWNNFEPSQTDVYYLDPTDPHYQTLGRRFIEIQNELFGTDHFYSCDSFNEVDPPTGDHEYLGQAARAVLQGIQSADPAGVWVVQGWLFHFAFWQPDRVQAYINGIQNNDDLLILDLNSEEGTLAQKFGDFHAKPWVWNLLHNYGGVRGVYGSLADLAANVGPFKEMYSKGPSRGRSNMVGIGFTPEAIEQNPVMYELLADTFWYPHRRAVTNIRCAGDSSAHHDGGATAAPSERDELNGGDMGPGEDGSDNEGGDNENDRRRARPLTDEENDEDGQDEFPTTEPSPAFGEGDEGTEEQSPVPPPRPTLRPRTKVGIDVVQWLSHYIRQRYAVPLRYPPYIAPPSGAAASGAPHAPYNASFRWAWDSLVAAVYDQHGHPRSEMEHRPQHPATDYGWFNGNPGLMVDAFRRFMDVVRLLRDYGAQGPTAAPGVGPATFYFDPTGGLGPFPGDPVEAAQSRARRTMRLGTVSYDLIDFARQAATYFFTAVHQVFNSEASVFLAGDYLADPTTRQYYTSHTTERQLAAFEGLRLSAERMRDIFDALDALFDTDPNYQMSTRWIKPAVRCANASDTAEIAQFIFNAKNQITQWGPDSQIDDYAAKAWSGLYRGYYKRRFAIVLDAVYDVASRLANGSDPNARYEPSRVSQQMLAFERQWSLETDYAREVIREVESDLKRVLGNVEVLRDTAKWLVGDEGAIHFAGKFGTHNEDTDDGDDVAVRDQEATSTFLAAERVQRLITVDPAALQKRYSRMVGDKIIAINWRARSGWINVRMYDAASLAALCDMHPLCVAFTADGTLYIGKDQDFTDRQRYQQETAAYLHRGRCGALVDGCNAHLSAARLSDEGEPGFSPASNRPSGGGVGGGVGNIPVNGKEWATDAPQSQT